MDLKEQTIASLKKYETRDEFSYLPALPKASVLIPLLVKDGQLQVLLNLKVHAGEVCFPGGKSESSDRNEIDTALREAEEEIGLPPNRVEVVCKLFPVLNKNGLLITPVVAFIEESFKASPNPHEVSEVFTLPLEFFTKEADHSCYPVPGAFGSTHSFIYTDPSTGNIHQIWGLTASLAIIVAVFALRKKPEFEIGLNLKDPVSQFKDVLNQRLSKL
ncbi:peroxisomal coenzyme A diphosphatase NUDT7 isoform X2 [Myxocyprinus asiaticus]|uniref:peroxisomal coenzyme A diphosphatase NUDT7 isoform X2 n=1 Tax=Myxocyprinus asiaticus TaxID=70543 RepID=UPI002223D8F3|nr:peroxisomal coenzyme A diphosphatase NUDT7 isoform X2 [Myxocyprinus asiaticus]